MAFPSVFHEIRQQHFISIQKEDIKMSAKRTKGKEGPWQALDGLDEE